MKFAPSAIALIFCLGLGACGGDEDESGGTGPTVSVEALEACLDRDPASDIERDDVDDTDGPRPVAQFDLLSQNVPNLVMVYADEEDADAGVQRLQGNDLAIIGEESTVRWVIVKREGRSDGKLDAMVARCVRQAS